MLIVRLAVSLSVTAIFTYGAMSLVATPVPAAKTSSKRTANGCPVEKQIEGDRCPCGEQINRSGKLCAPAPAASPRRIRTIVLGREAHSDYAGFVSRRTATGANAREAAGVMGIVGYFRPSEKSTKQTKTSGTKKPGA